MLPAIAAVLLAVPSCVSSGGWYGGRQGVWVPVDYERIAYENGYRRGFERGAADYRSGRVYEFRNERDYRNADWGYDSRLGPRGQYRQFFRSGYERGYSDGYRGQGAGRDPYGYPGGVYPRGGYPAPAPGRYPGGARSGYGYNSVAYDHGYRDGYEKGIEDLRDRDPYDPLRHGWYRDGDRHYNSRYGPREEYRRVYREGFRAGYDAVFRGGRY
ncbi:MAG: hypothetical protein ACE148_10155 [Vicinamibacterales bacterium]